MVFQIKTYIIYSRTERKSQYISISDNIVFIDFKINVIYNIIDYATT